MFIIIKIMINNLYLNTQPVQLYLYNSRDDYNNKNIKEIRQITFPNKIIFDKIDTKVNNKNIFNKSNNKYNPIIEYDKDKHIYNVKHMNLLPWTTVEELKYMIASIIQYDYNSVITLERMFAVDYVVNNEETNKKYSSCKYSIINNDVYENQMVIGYKQYIAHVIYQTYTTNTPYDYKFYENYTTLSKYITHMSFYGKITKEYIDKNKSCQNIDIYLLYNDNDMLTTYPIDIVKLFNINNINPNINKIVVHDNNLTNYNNEDREYQYVKANKDISEPFKNTFSRFNCCCVYIIHEIYPSITLSRIEFYKTGLIKCCFIINDPELEFDNVKNILSSYYNEKFWKLFNKFNVDECIYDFNFNIKNLVAIYGSFSFIYNIDNINTKRFVDLVNLSNQYIPEIVYKTNTSIFVSNYTNDSLECLHHYNYTDTFRPSITSTTMKLDISCHGHVQCIDENNIVLYFTRLYNINDLYVNAALFIPVLTDGINKDNNKKDKSNYDNLPPEQQIELIRQKYQKIPAKKGIKKLNEIDPILFGTRLVNNNDIRPYSALAQKKEQRVVSITKQEYDTIYKQYPEYVINIKNQSQTTQRLYLFCPWTKYPYLNFHHYHNQLCIPKCTTAINKKTQYLYCSNQLNAKGYKNNFSNETSKMVVYYSPLLLIGRKCFPPDELTNICENFLLTKLPTNIDVYKYCNHPCIIQRDNVNKQYILHTELDKNVNDYTLIIQSELDNGYYAVIDEENKPYIINDYKHFYDFLLSFQIDKNTGYTIFNFIDSVFKLDISKTYDYLTFSQVLQTLVDEHNIKFVISYNNDIVGIVYNGILLLTPSLQYENWQTLPTIKINIALDTLELPSLDMFYKRYITKYYADYNDETRQIKCIEYKNVNVLIKPINKNKPVILFDYEAYITYFKMISSKKLFIRKFEDSQKEQIIKNIINVYIYIQLMNDNNFVSLSNIPNLTDEPTVINYINNTPSWKKSKINRNDFADIYDKTFKNVNNQTKIDIIYNILQDNMYIYNNKDSIQITSKIITNNTM